MFGQLHVFLRLAEPVRYALERYTKEKDRLYGVLDRRLGEARYLAGEYSIADIALFAYTHCAADGGIELAPYPAVRAWLERVRAQPRFVPMQ